MIGKQSKVKGGETTATLLLVPVIIYHGLAILALISSV